MYATPAPTRQVYTTHPVLEVLDHADEMPRRQDVLAQLAAAGVVYGESLWLQFL